MRPRLKVCCIASVEEAEIAAVHGAWAIGLVSAMPSGPGVIADDAIAEISAGAPRALARFLLTCRSDGHAVVEQLVATGVDTVQLVDAVAPGAYAVIRRERPETRIVQVIHVEDEDALEEARAAAADGADMLLLDSGTPGAAVKLLGGTGRVHDWAVSRRIVEAVGIPVLLAGGMRPDNVGTALATVRPWGIDICSGVRSDGRLDPGKLAALVGAMGAARLA